MPPISASMKRFGVNPCGCSTVVTKIADTPAWLMRIVPPPSSSAAPIDSATTSISTGVLVPSALTMRSATAMPTATPMTSSIARLVRCPRVAASETTAEIGAKNGESLTCWAMSHAAPTAIDVCAIVHRPARSRLVRCRTWPRSSGISGRWARRYGRPGGTAPIVAWCGFAGGAGRALCGGAPRLSPG